jgi:Gpi18-like mannosyltransferase
MKTLNKLNYTDLIIAIAGIALAIAVRYSLLDFKSIDFFKYTKVWFNTVKGEGFSAFGHNFSNYNPPYLYLLYLIARYFPVTSIVTATKLPPIIADFISAWFTYRIVRLKYIDSPIPVLASFAILFAPTVVINSAFWGQADALYTCALLAALYFIFTKKFGLAMLMFGLSVSFKAQAVFLLPLLIALLIRKEIPWKYYLFIPLVMFLALVPAWIAGRSLLDLLLIYPSQAGQYMQLSMNAPSAFSLIPDSGRFFIYYYHAGLIAAVAAGIFYSIFVYKSHNNLTPSILLELALLTILMMPFLLPKMHERNFYPADVISIVFAFYYPRYLFVPIVMSVTSFFSYQPTLFAAEPVPISWLALGILTLIIFLGQDVIIQLFPTEKEIENLEKK